MRRIQNLITTGNEGSDRRNIDTTEYGTEAMQEPPDRTENPQGRLRCRKFVKN